MIDATEITERLQSMAQARGIDILFAVQAGPMAYGVAGPNSDTVVRFVYIHPTDWY